MISFFPEMYPDELLYSVFARYHKFSGNQRGSLTTLDLCGYKQRITCNPVVLPRNLDYLIKQIQEYSVSYEELIYKRTLFPYIALFSSSYVMKLAKKWSFSLLNRITSSDVGTRLYLDIRMGPLKYCPICLEEEYKTYGEAYWHRQHQIPGVFVCTKHRIALHESQYSVLRWNEYHTPEKPTNLSSKRTYVLNANDMKIAIQLADGIQWLFNNFNMVRRLWKKYVCCFGDLYYHFLAQKGLVTKYGVILFSQFNRDFLRYYGKNLSIFFVPLKNQFEYWPTSIFLNGRNHQGAIYHFLMMQYLSGSIQQFFEQLKQYKLNETEISKRCYYFFCSYPNLFDKDSVKFRSIWMKRHDLSCYWYWRQVKSDQRDIKQSMSAFNWLYKYDFDWLADNLFTEENASDFERIKKKRQHDLESWMGCSEQYLLSRIKLRRFKRKIFIKSLEETRKAYFERRLSRNKRRQLVSSS